MRNVVGSLLTKLTDKDLSKLEIIIYNLETKPNSHAVAVNELPLCANVVDATSIIQPSTKVTQDSWHAKESRNYATALTHCSERARYTLMLEDDVVLSTLAPMWTLFESQPNEDDANWLCLRLFNTETFMGYQLCFIHEIVLWTAAAVFDPSIVV